MISQGSCKLLIMGMLISTEHNNTLKKIQNKTDTHTRQKTYKTSHVQDKVLMQSLQQKCLMVWSSSC